MISDTQLALCANILGVAIFLLVIVYHLVVAAAPQQSAQEAQAEKKRD